MSKVLITCSLPIARPLAGRATQRALWLVSQPKERIKGREGSCLRNLLRSVSVLVEKTSLSVMAITSFFSLLQLCEDHGSSYTHLAPLDNLSDFFLAPKYHQQPYNLSIGQGILCLWR